MLHFLEFELKEIVLTSFGQGLNRKTNCFE
jgi:hypothetical protein